jgi:butyryl-CoA dehydrogenase
MLTEEQRQIQDTARQFAKNKLAPMSASWDRGEGVPPRDVFAELAKLGFMGMCVPAEWGGAETDFLSYVLALEEIAAGDGGVSTVMSVNNSPVAAALNTYGTPEQKDRFLRPLISGDSNGAFCLTEPHTGSDASAIRTRAKLEGNKWVLSGT